MKMKRMAAVAVAAMALSTINAAAALAAPPGDSTCNFSGGVLEIIMGTDSDNVEVYVESDGYYDTILYCSADDGDWDGNIDDVESVSVLSFGSGTFTIDLVDNDYDNGIADYKGIEFNLDLGTYGSGDFYLDGDALDNLLLSSAHKLHVTIGASGDEFSIPEANLEGTITYDPDANELDIDGGDDDDVYDLSEAEFLSVDDLDGGGGVDVIYGQEVGQEDLYGTIVYPGRAGNGETDYIYANDNTLKVVSFKGISDDLYVLDDDIDGGRWESYIDEPVKLTLGSGDDEFYDTGLCYVKVNGGPGDDILVGDNCNDKLLGGPGDDTLKGFYGDDQLFGGEGSDFAAGGRSESASVDVCVAERVIDCEIIRRR